MIIKQLIDEDFVNYCKPSMFIAFPSCTFKCERDCNMQVCQNSELAKSKNIEISEQKIIDRYINNSITQSIVCGGLEPFDSFGELYGLIYALRLVTNDEIVIYTGYTESELSNQLLALEIFDNLIIKFGRYIPNQEKHFDEVLGVNLASNNQYARKIT